MRQIPPINRHFTETPYTFFVFMAGNNHDPSTSFPYCFFCNLLQKLMRAHNKYGVIMPRLVQTLRDCSCTFTSTDLYPGAPSGALDLSNRARICKWVALGLKFHSSPIQNAVKPLWIERESSLLIQLWVYGRPLCWRPQRSREGCHLTPIKLTPFLTILWIPLRRNSMHFPESWESKPCPKKLQLKMDNGVSNCLASTCNVPTISKPSSSLRKPYGPINLSGGTSGPTEPSPDEGPGSHCESNSAQSSWGSASC